ncbi:MAG: sulfotransferase domain-containing protein, partial [Caldilineaceae bacterium]
VSLFHFMTSRADLRLQSEWDDFFEAYVQGQVPYGDWFDHNLAWWDASQTAGNILFVKYEEMQKDLAASVEAVAAFIDFPLTPDLRNRVVAQSTFAAMAANTKANWNLNPTQNGAADKHLRKGVVGDWQNHFSKVQLDRYDTLYRQAMAGSGLDFDFERTAA